MVYQTAPIPPALGAIPLDAFQLRMIIVGFSTTSPWRQNGVYDSVLPREAGYTIALPFKVNTPNCPC